MRVAGPGTDVVHDPATYERGAPLGVLDELRETDGRQHLVFGHGPHMCLGAHLARVQMRAMFEELLRRTSWFEPAGEPALLRSSFQRGVKRLPVRWLE